MNAVDIPRRRLDWTAAVRVVSGRLRPGAAFEQVAGPEDLAAVVEILAAGRVHIPLADLPVGLGASYVLTPFRTPRASRFSDGTFGVLYASTSERVARAEYGFHLSRFLAATAEPAQPLVLHQLSLAIHGRGFRALDAVAGRHGDLLDPDPAKYGRPQSVGAQLRAEGAEGIRYPSVRAPGGRCAGVFRPRCVRRCVVAARLTVDWTGASLSQWWELRPLA